MITIIYLIAGLVLGGLTTYMPNTPLVLACFIASFLCMFGFIVTLINRFT